MSFFVHFHLFNVICVLSATLFGQAFLLFRLQEFKKEQIFVIKFFYPLNDRFDFKVRNKTFVAVTFRSEKVCCKPFAE